MCPGRIKSNSWTYLERHIFSTVNDSLAMNGYACQPFDFVEDGLPTIGFADRHVDTPFAIAGGRLELDIANKFETSGDHGEELQIRLPVVVSSCECLANEGRSRLVSVCKRRQNYRMESHCSNRFSRSTTVTYGHHLNSAQVPTPYSNFVSTPQQKHQLQGQKNNKKTAKCLQTLQPQGSHRLS